MSDYIEREALLHKIRWASAVEECVMSVRRMPAAGVVPVKHGMWEKTNMDGFLRCSACHDCYIDEDWLDGKKWNFCPECGAKMNGGDDDAAD